MQQMFTNEGFFRGFCCFLFFFSFLQMTTLRSVWSKHHHLVRPQDCDAKSWELLSLPPSLWSPFPAVGHASASSPCLALTSWLCYVGVWFDSSMCVLSLC